jgi:uncharacterized protein (DUF2249 family)
VSGGAAETERELDVRPVLAAGGEPLQDILELAQATPPGGAFVVVAPFDPAPLRGLLAGSGFTAETQNPAAGYWRVRFTRQSR